MRLYPGSVRRAVLDGVAPPDMALPMSFSTDAQSALDALLADCEQAPGCHQAFPRLRSQWQAVLAGLPKAVSVQHPLTGLEERLTLTREMLVGLVRLPLYAPMLAAGLPMAISEAAEGRFGPLASLSSSVLPGRAQGLAAGMHFSVVCAEDMPRLASSQDKAGADFGEATLTMYRRVCQGWPQAAVDPAFYTMPATPAGTLLLSGSLDPVTPPRHGERAARALGPQALHLSVPNVGHGVIAAVPCMRDAVFRFIDNESQADALAQARADAACAARLPRPPAVRALADRQEPASGARP
jgi:pimeloyl-ACP methyl ester carboxylesterase